MTEKCCVCGNKIQIGYVHKKKYLCGDCAKPILKNIYKEEKTKI